MRNIRYLLLILLTTISCRNQEFTFHYYNGLNISKNSTWASSLQDFFSKDDNMKEKKLNNKNLKKEFINIKDKIILKDQVIDFDDGNYTFAFVIEKDTLYADDRLEFWRYKDKGLSYKLNFVSKNEILKKYKIPFNQK